MEYLQIFTRVLFGREILNEEVVELELRRGSLTLSQVPGHLQCVLALTHLEAVHLQVVRDIQ